MRVLFVGGHELGAITLDYLIKSKVNIIGAIITETCNEWYSGVDIIANKYKLPLIKTNNINEEKLYQKLKTMNIDLIVSVNFDQILKNNIINLPVKGCINTHASLLPKYRGRAPLNWAVLNGEKEVGVTVHYIEEGIDTGDIILQKEIRISENDYIDDILEKVKSIYPEIVYDSIMLIENNSVIRKKQNNSEGSYFGKRSESDGEIDFSLSGNEILNLIRAISKPYPGAFFMENNEKYIVWKAELRWDLNDISEEYKVGTIFKHNSKYVLKLKDSVLIMDEFEIRSGSIVDED